MSLVKLLSDGDPPGKAGAAAALGSLAANAGIRKDIRCRAVEG